MGDESVRGQLRLSSNDRHFLVYSHTDQTMTYNCGHHMSSGATIGGGIHLCTTYICKCIYTTSQERMAIPIKIKTSWTEC